MIDDRELLERLSATVTAMVGFYKGVDDTSFLAGSAWTARGVLVHVVFWHESFARNVSDLARGIKPKPLKGTYAELGRCSLDESSNCSVEDLLARLLSAQRSIEESIFNPRVVLIPYKVGSRSYTPAEHLSVVNDHVKDHLKKVHSAHVRSSIG